MQTIKTLTDREQENISLLIAKKVFSIRKGEVVLSFNDSGVITDIDIHEKKYKRKKLDREI